MAKSEGEYYKPKDYMLTKTYKILEDDWSWACSAEGKSDLKYWWSVADADGSGEVTWDEIEAAFP